MKKRSILFFVPFLLLTMLMLNSCSEECKEARTECMADCPTEEEYAECLSDCGPFPGPDATREERDAHAACILKCQSPTKCRDKCNEDFLECEKND